MSRATLALWNLVAEFGDVTTDVMEQMIEGGWTDGDGHSVHQGAEMLRMAATVNQALAVRAKIIDGGLMDVEADLLAALEEAVPCLTGQEWEIATAAIAKARRARGVSQ